MNKRKIAGGKHSECVARFLRLRPTVEIDIDWQHLAERGRQMFDQATDIEETVRTGRIDEEESKEFPERPYDKFCLYRYFGKQKRTFELIFLYQRERNEGQVRTVWVHEGQRPAKRRPRKSRSRNG